MNEIFAYPLCAHVFEIASMAFIALYVELGIRPMKYVPPQPARSIVRRAL